MPHTPHRLNVIGDFYVVDQCCTECGVPELNAPDLFGLAQGHCYVKKQPVSDLELERMILTVSFAELRCVRYRGSDDVIIEALKAADSADVCDALPETRSAT